MKTTVICLYFSVLVGTILGFCIAAQLDKKIQEVERKIEKQEFVIATMANVLLNNMEDEKRVVEDSILNMEVPNIYIPNSEDPFFWIPEIVESGGDA